MPLRQTILLLIFFLVSFTLFSQGTWVQKANFGGLARQGAVSFAISNKGYVVTGRQNTGGPYYNDFWEYDPSNDSWTQKANFLGMGREGATGFSIGTKGYIGTGFNSGVYYQDFWEWDQMTNLWTQKNNFGGGIDWGSVSFSINNKGYIYKGFSTIINDFWEYDPSNDSWTQKAGFAAAGKMLAISFVIGMKGYVGTGMDMNTAPMGTQDFWEYNATTNSWVQKANFPGAPREEATGFSIGNFGYLGMGTTKIGTGTISDFWEYDPSNDSWTQQVDFGGGLRELAFSFSIGCKGYVGAGFINDANNQNDFWEFTPDASCSTPNSSPCERPLVIPNIFTPNGDGVNDVFVIEGVDKCNEFSINIFDRWGALMFATIKPKDYWDGRTSAGFKVSAGTYYYVLTANKENKKGSVTLAR